MVAVPAGDTHSRFDIERGHGSMRRDGKNFGQRLREARIAAGLSQSDLEEISGIPKARLSRYENGHVAPSIQTLERLANALKVSEASLLGDERAVLESFFARLQERGIEIENPEQGARLADAVADMLLAARAAGRAGTETESPLAETSLASVGDLLTLERPAT
jgi:transcriptional regulator with XRE-family HTH domain